jgi:DNA-binding NarL/FixJ family response regulator
VQPLGSERPPYDGKESTAWTGLSMKQIRVLIVDEHLAVRRALSARLSAFGQIDVVATAGDFQHGQELAHDLHPDVILLELKGASKLQPDPVGEMARALSGHPAGIIVLTSYADGDEREAALNAGARRYLLKQIDTASLLHEIETVATEASGTAS